ncbi:hypothetical protein ACFLZ7_02575 [Nanoarchaeota archaeon]
MPKKFDWKKIPVLVWLFAGGAFLLLIGQTASSPFIFYLGLLSVVGGLMLGLFWLLHKIIH